MTEITHTRSGFTAATAAELADKLKASKSAIERLTTFINDEMLQPGVTPDDPKVRGLRMMRDTLIERREALHQVLNVMRSSIGISYRDKDGIQHTFW